MRQRKEERVMQERSTSTPAFKQLLGENLDRAKALTKALGGFTAKDMQPWATVEDAGFQLMI